jgi:hypothetical protein
MNSFSVPIRSLHITVGRMGKGQQEPEQVVLIFRVETKGLAKDVGTTYRQAITVRK